MEFCQESTNSKQFRTVNLPKQSIKSDNSWDWVISSDPISEIFPRLGHPYTNSLAKKQNEEW
jgi:hypothetical protein